MFQGCLQAMAGVQLELPLEHMYSGDWDLQRALAYMAERGFTPSQVYPNNKLPMKFMFATTRERGLILITCTGVFHRDGTGYDHKRLVYARLIS